MLYTAVWAGAAYLARQQVDRWIANARADGAQISHGDVLLDGYPGHVIIRLPQWSMTEPVTNGGWSWRTDQISASARPWSPLQFTVDLTGTHKVAGLWSPPGVAADITFGRADISPVLTLDGALRSIRARIEDARVIDPQAPEAAWVSLTSGHVIVEPRPPSEPENLPMWHIELEATGLGFPKADVAPFDPGVRRVYLVSDLVGPIAPGPMRQSLEAWRQSGGTLELRELLLEWPPLSVAGSGTISLDNKLQPIGAAAMKFRGFFETVDGLADHGAVEPASATMARVVLGLLARTPPEGGPLELSIAVTAQDGKLYAGPLSLMDLPPVDWSDLEAPALP